MSCWMVSKTHIDTLVGAMIMTELLDTDPDTAGRRLLTTNQRAVAERYPDDVTSHSLPGWDWSAGIDTYTYRYPGGISRDLGDLIRILKAVRCYQYQSDGHDAYAQSWSNLRLEELEAVLLCCLTEDWQREEPHPHLPDATEPHVYHSALYDAAPWGIDDAE